MNRALYFKSSKNWRFALGLFVLLGFGGIASLFTYHRLSTTSNVAENISESRPAGNRLEIRGVRYDGNFEGKRILSIDAEKFTIEKKKVGFLRFGLLNVARFDNAHIRIYGRDTSPANQPNNQLEKSSSKKLTFEGVFSKNSLPSLPAKNISSILMAPVKIDLNAGPTVVTRISAASAELSIIRRSITFKGNVRVASGERVLAAEQLDLLPEEGVIKTEGHFTLKTRSKELDGYRLTSDIYLNPVPF